MERYKLRQGKLRPDPSGEWVRADASLGREYLIVRLNRISRRAGEYHAHGGGNRFKVLEQMVESLLGECTAAEAAEGE